MNSKPTSWEYVFRNTAILVILGKTNHRVEMRIRGVCGRGKPASNGVQGLVSAKVQQTLK